MSNHKSQESDADIGLCLRNLYWTEPALIQLQGKMDAQGVGDCTNGSYNANTCNNGVHAEYQCGGGSFGGA